MGMKTAEQLFRLLDIIEVLPANDLTSQVPSSLKCSNGWVKGIITKIHKMVNGPLGTGHHYHFIIEEDNKFSYVMTITDQESSIYDYFKTGKLSTEEALTHRDRRIRRLAHNQVAVNEVLDNHEIKRSTLGRSRRR